MSIYKWLIPLALFVLSMIALFIGYKIVDKQTEKENEEKKHIPHWYW
jgi:flagellar biosynthesis/type III secretory pathway M-ring protein FliF/YscJ